MILWRTSRLHCFLLKGIDFCLVWQLNYCRLYCLYQTLFYSLLDYYYFNLELSFWIADPTLGYVLSPTGRVFLGSWLNAHSAQNISPLEQDKIFNISQHCMISCITSWFRSLLSTYSHPVHRWYYPGHASLMDPDSNFWSHCPDEFFLLWCPVLQISSKWHI